MCRNRKKVSTIICRYPWGAATALGMDILTEMYFHYQSVKQFLIFRAVTYTWTILDGLQPLKGSTLIDVSGKYTIMR